VLRGSGPGTGTIQSAMVGTAGPHTIVSGLTTPLDIAVDGTRVYWTTYLDGRVLSVSVGGGAIAVVATGQTQTQGIAVEPTRG
jgi:hypothetical protein